VGVGPFNHQVLGTRRTSKGNDPALREALSVFVDNYDSQEQKKQILDDNKCFIEFLEHVSPKFEVLKDLMYAWRCILSLAYRY